MPHYSWGGSLVSRIPFTMRNLGPMRWKVSLPTAGALNFSIIYPSLASPGAQPQTWIHRVPALRIPQSLPPSDGWSSLKETWRNKSGHQQDCQIILPWLSHSLGVKIDGGCKQLGGKSCHWNQFLASFQSTSITWLGKGFCHKNI